MIFDFFGVNVPRKGCKTDEMNTTIQFYLFELVQVPSFGLNWHFLFFGVNFPKKGIPGLSNTEKKNENHRWILHIRISLDTKFQLKLTILIFWTKFTQKKLFLAQNRRSKHHPWILHTRIDLASKFQLKNFGTNLAQNGFSGQKWKEWISPLDSTYSN